MADRNPIPATPRPGFHHPDAPTTARERYVVGFCLDHRRELVLLVRKNKPAWQAGKLNGVGGRIEAHDLTPRHAMQREWAEEVAGGPDVSWREAMTLRSGDVEIVVFTGRASADVLRAHDGTVNDIGECLELRSVHDLPSAGTLPNLSWLVPLAAYEHDVYRPFVVTETA